jgi:methionyl-tRNA formyltransferase
MRVVFLGTPEFAIPSLRELIGSRYEVVAVFTQPDRPAGRGQRLHASPVKTLAQELGIPVFTPERLRNEENRRVVEGLAPDFIVVVAYGQILPGWFLGAARVAPVNVHGSLLPRYRGAAPVIWTLLNGDTVTGVTTMWMDEHLDTGDILLRAELPVPDTMTGGELAEKLAHLGAGLILPTLDGLDAGTLRRLPQDHAQATMAPRIGKAMGSIDWKRPAREIHNLVRAFNPRPLAYTGFRGSKLQVLRSYPAPDQEPLEAASGIYLGTRGDAMRISCGGGTALDLLEVQLAGRSVVSGREFVSGARILPGTALQPE